MSNFAEMSASVLQSYGDQAGAGPFSFLFRGGLGESTLSAILAWHGVALGAVIAAALIAGLFCKSGPRGQSGPR